MKKLLMVCVLAGLSGCAVLDGSFGKPKAPPKSRQQIIAELNAKYPGCPHIESDSIYDLYNGDWLCAKWLKRENSPEGQLRKAYEEGRISHEQYCLEVMSQYGFHPTYGSAYGCDMDEERRKYWDRVEQERREALEYYEKTKDKYHKCMSKAVPQQGTHKAMESCRQVYMPRRKN